MSYAGPWLCCGKKVRQADSITRRVTQRVSRLEGVWQESQHWADSVVGQRAHPVGEHGSAGGGSGWGGAVQAEESCECWKSGTREEPPRRRWSSLLYIFLVISSQIMPSKIATLWHCTKQNKRHFRHCKDWKYFLYMIVGRGISCRVVPRTFLFSLGQFSWNSWDL